VTLKSFTKHITAMRDLGFLTHEAAAQVIQAATAFDAAHGKRKGEKPEPVTLEAWEAYREAFLERHGAEPLRENIHLSGIIRKVGKGIAPDLLRFYLKHSDALYVRSKHPLALAHRDASRLYAEMQTGVVTTQKQAQVQESYDQSVRAVQSYYRKKHGVKP
jgi:hypothetical protein